MAFVIPPSMPPQLFVFVITRPFSIRNGSLFSLPRISAAAKPAPNSIPFIAGTAKTALAMRPSIPPKSGPPSPASSPVMRHSIVPPTLSPSAFAAAISRRMASPAASLTVGKGLSAVGSISSPASCTLPMDAMRLIMLMPCCCKSCMHIPPAMQSGAVSLPEKCPPPARSSKPRYFISAV